MLIIQWVPSKVKEPINEELINKLVLKSVDVEQLTISEMRFCSPELRSQLMNYSAEVITKKTELTENRLCKYE